MGLFKMVVNTVALVRISELLFGNTTRSTAIRGSVVKLLHETQATDQRASAAAGVSRGRATQADSAAPGLVAAASVAMRPRSTVTPSSGFDGVVVGARVN
jgi:hypothetical protein